MLEVDRDIRLIRRARVVEIDAAGIPVDGAGDRRYARIRREDGIVVVPLVAAVDFRREHVIGQPRGSFLHLLHPKLFHQR